MKVVVITLNLMYYRIRILPVKAPEMSNRILIAHRFLMNREIIADYQTWLR